MDKYLTGATIKELREKRRMTQAQLAEMLSVSDKAVSKWETGAGYPDITLLEPIACALHVSVAELLAGSAVKNENVSANMLRSHFYVCPVCSNSIHSMGEAHISCHGISLPPLSAEPTEDKHAIHVTSENDELFVRVEHPMDKLHHIVFLAAVSPDSVQIARLYPEGPAQAYFKR
ncbi:MAG: helix-turn-helix domain-containing protein, partial [Eggerthellaceae bacterium]|nr:helix-turn-helix domain-containing protein [Eggerthellaceae bacterium]